jgi:hypothetical protein
MHACEKNNTQPGRACVPTDPCVLGVQSPRVCECCEFGGSWACTPRHPSRYARGKRVHGATAEGFWGRALQVE